jgi:hypothetical protein
VQGSVRATGFGSSVVFDLKSKEHRAVAIGEDWQSVTHCHSVNLVRVLYLYPLPDAPTPPIGP